MRRRIFSVLAVILFFALFSGVAEVSAAPKAPVPGTARFANLAKDYPSLFNEGVYFGKIVMKQRKQDLTTPPWTTLHQNLQNRAWEVYRRWRLASRGGYVNSPTITLEATAYDPGPISCGPYADGRTSTGMRAGYGIAAVDPRVVPLGTHLYVEGYGYAIAADIGSAIKGDRIDLCFNTYREAIQFGRRRVRVYLLNR